MFGWDEECVGSNPFEQEELIAEAVREATPHKCSKCDEAGALQYSCGYPAGYWCNKHWKTSGYKDSNDEEYNYECEDY